MIPATDRFHNADTEIDQFDFLKIFLLLPEYSILKIDTEARIISWNAGTEQLYQYCPNELPGKNLSDFYNSGKNESEQPWTSLLLAKENRTHEHSGWHYRRNGSKFYANTLFITIYDKQNRVKGFVHVSKDLTCMKQADEKNKASIAQLKDICVSQKKELDNVNQKIQSFLPDNSSDKIPTFCTDQAHILESIGDGFFAVDNSFKVIYWNTKAEQILNKKRETIIGKVLWNEYPDIINTKFYTCYKQAAEDKNPLKFEEYYAAFDLWFKVNVYPSPTGLSVYFQDITEQKKAEKALKESEFRYRQIVETAQEGIWVIDEDCKTTFANEKLCAILGYPHDEMIGRTSIFFKDNDCREEMQKNLNGRKQAVAEVYETTFITKTGKKIWAQVSTSPLLDHNGNYKGALAMVTDLTDKKILQTKLLDEQLLAQDQIMRAVVDAQERERAGIGAELHDNVNQLLATSRLYINICLSKQLYQKESLLKSQEYINEAIEEIRKLSHALVGPTQDKIMGLIASIEDLIFDISRAKKININFTHSTFREQRYEVEFKLVIYRIIQEQINNIVKHANASNVNIELMKEGADLLVVIDDNGQGFDTSLPMEGIGLNNIFNRAKLYNGTVQIISSPGNGCQIKITFKNHGIGKGMRLSN